MLHSVENIVAKAGKIFEKSDKFVVTLQVEVSSKVTKLSFIASDDVTQKRISTSGKSVEEVVEKLASKLTTGIPKGFYIILSECAFIHPLPLTRSVILTIGTLHRYNIFFLADSGPVGIGKATRCSNIVHAVTVLDQLNSKNVKAQVVHIQRNKLTGNYLVQPVLTMPTLEP